MLNLREEIQGIAQAREDRRRVRLLAEALTGALATGMLNDETTAALFEAATHHGVLGLFELHHPQFQPALMSQRARAMRALKFTRRVVDAIERADIPVAVLKGSVAASRWLDPTLRQQSDVDVLVEKRNKDAAAKALIDAGVCSTRFLESEHMHNDSLQPAEPSGLLVEVHHYFNNHHENRVDVAELLARRTRVKTAQGPLPALSAEDDAVFLALHATTHALQRLAWLVDLAALKVDWSEAALRAQQWNVWLPVSLAWERTRELLGVPIPVPDDTPPQLRFARMLLRAGDASGGALHRFFERSLRLGVVPFTALPSVLLQKLHARREEREGYASRANRSE